MQYIIMCGGPGSGKPLQRINGEALVERTMRLLRENGVRDIAISSNDDRYERFGVPVLHHDNPLTVKGYYWLKCFYPATRPVCYIYGDVLYSPEAIRCIVETETEDIMFFASSPPFNEKYTKRWAEPFAFKVWNVERFFDCVARTIALDKQNRFNRRPISWELWQVIKKTPLNIIDYGNYVAINDYTVDIDDAEQIRLITDRGYI